MDPGTSVDPSPALVHTQSQPFTNPISSSGPAASRGVPELIPVVGASSLGNSVTPEVSPLPQSRFEPPTVQLKWVPKAVKKAQSKALMVRDESQAGFGNLAVNPILGQILGAMVRPHFSGRVEDWQQFAKDWLEYVKVLTSMVPPGQEMPDILLLQALKGCLDEITRQELQKLMEENPELTYTLFWAQLQAEFGGDVNHQHRAAWKKVQLDSKTPLTFQSWRKFWMEFDLKKQRVEDRTEGEEYELIFKQLPEKWRVEVAKEEGRRRKRQFWVRISNLHGLTPEDVKRNFQQILDAPLESVKLVSGGYLLECGEEKIRQKALAMDGDELGGVVIKVTPVEKKMDGDEILKFVAQRLRELDELRNLEESLGLRGKERPEPVQSPMLKWGKAPKVQQVADNGADVCLPVSPPLQVTPSWMEYVDYTNFNPPEQSQWVQGVAKGKGGKGFVPAPGYFKGKGKGNGKGKGKGGSWGGRGESSQRVGPQVSAPHRPLLPLDLLS